MKKVLTRGRFCDIITLPLRKRLFCCACANPNKTDGTQHLSEGGTHYPCAPWRADKSKLQEVPISMANEVRVKVTLVCSECKQRNYDTKKNKKNDPDRIELKKYCRFCRKHTIHKESK